jgi:hypothetical protein
VYSNHKIFVEATAIKLATSGNEESCGNINAAAIVLMVPTHTHAQDV